MNLLLDADPGVEQTLIDSLGVAASLVDVRSTPHKVVAMNELHRQHYGIRSGLTSMMLTIDAIVDATGASEQQASGFLARALENEETCIERREPLMIENSLVRADGQRVWARTTLTPIFRDQQVHYLLGALIDITAFISVQSRLEQSIVQLLGRHVHVCRNCKRIEDDGQWVQLENYTGSRKRYTHGICESCCRELT